VSGPRPPAAVAIEVEYWPDTAARLQRLAGQPWFALLDSCRFAAGSGRYDVAGWAPRTTLMTRGALTTITDARGVRTSDADPLALLRAELGDEPPTLDLPFSGGAIGAFAYDLARRWMRLPDSAVRDIDFPEMAVAIHDRALVVDHVAERAWYVQRGQPQAIVAADQAALAVPRTLTPAVLGPRFVVSSNVAPDIARADYARAFARIQRYLRDGDCYQVNYTQRFSATAAGDPFDAYLRLRRLNPAPYAAFLRVPGAAVLCSSPERFIAVADGEVVTHPIKGTRPRDADPLRDRALADELLASAKDRAENIMIVDLLRNDLGRRCATGSVAVPRLCALESFARVHHLVSEVRGRLRADTHALDVLRDCFPGGSITGAPKQRAMEIIEELEPARRSVYCGAIGYVGHDGRMDTNIAIRTLLFARDRLYCWAGGGIVIDSAADAEYQECLDKAAAMLSVFADAAGLHLDR
jgi:para-aminobenzoate synthetase component 1